jgi:uncharacterized membrane protein YqgA involved in biofilm formation
MIGTVVNVSLVLAGGTLGLLMKRSLPRKWEELLFQAMGLFTVGLGIVMLLRPMRPISLVTGLILGALAGEALDIEKGLGSFAQRAKARLGGGEKFVDGTVLAFLTFCVGPMTILGALQDGMGDPSILIVKSIMDGFVSIAYASALGAGVLLSSVLMSAYQMTLSLLSSAIKPYMTQVIVDNMSAQGGMLLFGLGLNLLEIKKVRVANMLPAIVAVPIITWILLPFGL